ncbi:MAG: cyclase family protein [Gammaproteobacteria bacterium]|jgi:hypothetical protein|nr:cyclase family protein [Gammaproteobacteria bacterium]
MYRTKNLFLVLLFVFFVHQKVVADAEQWFPSKYGADDSIGAANNLSSDKILQAARLIKKGKSYSLAIDTGADTLAPPFRSFQMHIMHPGDGTGAPAGSLQATANDDMMIVWPGIGTQIDGLGHAGINHQYYNGVHARDFVRSSGLLKYGTHTIPPIVTRGLLLDMAAFLGQDILPAGTAFGRKEIDGAAKRQGLRIDKGDVVIFHTGWMKNYEKGAKAWLWQGWPGLNDEGAKYLADLGVVAVGADNAGLEVWDGKGGAPGAAVHQTLLSKNGVYIIEGVWTLDLAADNVDEFLFVLGQPKFVGAAQMVVNPIAIN